MTLVTPGLALAGILAMTIPVVIHFLFRRRRKPVRWGAMQFLLEAMRKHHRRLQLEQIILLAVRMLILAAFGLALARPWLEDGGRLNLGGGRTVYLILDNGLCAMVEDEGGVSALEKHRKLAVQVVEELGTGDRVSVVLAGRPSHAPLTPPSTDHRAVIDFIRSIEPTEAATDLDGALARLHNLLDEGDESDREALVYLFSEFRAGSADLEAPLPKIIESSEDSVSEGLASGGRDWVRFFAVPPETTAIGNVQISSIEPVRRLVTVDEGSGTDGGSPRRGADRITVRLIRTGGGLEADVSTVRLTGEGMENPIVQSVKWIPGQTEASVDFTVRLAAGRNGDTALTAALNDDALSADNRRQVILEVRRQIRVLLADRRSFGFEPGLDRLHSGQWMRRALVPLESGMMDLVEADAAALDPADIRGVDAVILPRPDLLKDAGWKLLGDFVEGGGLLIITPPGELNVHPWTAHLATDLGLSWRIALEVEAPAEPMILAAEQPRSETLRLLSSELQNLVRPVEVYRVLKIDGDEIPGTPLLNFADGSPFIIMGNPGSGGAVVYVATAPELEWTNLPSKPLMVPLMHELVRQGLSVIRAADRITVGERPLISSRSGGGGGLHGMSVMLVDEEGETIMVGEDGRSAEPIRRGGVYEIRDRMSRAQGLLAVNVEPRAADTSVQPSGAVRLWLWASAPWSWADTQNFTALSDEDRSGSPVAAYLLWLVLSLLLVETVLARWFSHAQVRQSAPSGLRARGQMVTGGRV